MKNIRIISAMLALLMVVFVFASCQKTDPDPLESSSEESSTTSTTPAPVITPTPEKKDPAKFLQFTIDFEDVEKVSEIEVPVDGFEFERSGDVVIEDGELKIGYSKEEKGLFKIVDSDLALDGRYKNITMTMDWTVEEFPAEGGSISVVSPIYSSDAYDGTYYQFFFKINSDGTVSKYHPKKWTEPALYKNGKPVTLELGKTYQLLCNFELGGAYEYYVQLDGEFIASGTLSYTFTEDDTTDFYLRFGDTNQDYDGSYKMKFDNIMFRCVPNTGR